MDYIKAYSLMYTSRALDKKMLIMLKGGKSYFHIGAMGHEAIQVASGLHMHPKTDWLFPYYRDQALCLTLGMTAKECLLGFLARGTDPSSGGRQMPQHYGRAGLNIPSSSSPTGSQFLQAVGCALATKLNTQKASKRTNEMEVTVVCAGDGTTSQGDFHEALNWASRESLPVVFLIENNRYAISVPVSEQRPKGHVGTLARGYEGLDLVEVDGCDFQASLEAMKKAIERARRGEGPTLVDADVVRLLPHSSSDDQRKYRPSDELAADEARDPIRHMRNWLMQDKHISEAELLKLEKSIDVEVSNTADEAEATPPPEKKSALLFVDSGKPEPQASSFKENGDGAEIVLVDAINRALDEEMQANKKMLVFGQDVAKGKGGVFTATRGLTDKHGDRCFNAPLAESSIVGVAIGLSLRGFKPVAEIQFGDYIWTAMNQIRNELVTMRYRSNNAFSSPAVLRVPVGGYIHGGLCHSQNIEATFSHFPGLKVVLPSTAIDAYGLLKAAIRGDDPVLFLEHKSLYRQNFAKSRLPDDPDFLLPFGKGRIRKEGRDLTIITYGALVQRSLEAARIVEEEGVNVEIVDLCSIRPLDFDLIRTSVAKTSRALVLYEDNRFMGFGAEIAAQIAESCFELLDAPIKRVAGADCPIPYAPDLEDEVLPQVRHIVEGIRDLAGY